MGMWRKGCSGIGFGIVQKGFGEFDLRVYGRDGSQVGF